MPGQYGEEYTPQHNSIALFHVDDVPAARAELEAKGVEFDGETIDTSVCHMATFFDPDRNRLTLHKRYKPYE
jgi:predicted enzyme related to lactoylglutathione lyase